MKPTKRIFLLLPVVLACLAVAVACSNQDGEATAATPNEKTPITLDAELHGWFEQGSALIHRDKFEAMSCDAVSLSMAKNEKEAFQYILASTAAHEDLRCEVSDLTDGKGNTLKGTVYVAWNVYIRKAYGSYERGLTPSALLEQDNAYQGGTFDLKANCSKTVYVLYETTKDTVPGTYTGKLEIKQGNRVVKTGDVTVAVWDIYYDEATECISMYQYGYIGQGSGAVPGTAPNFRSRPELYEIYADYLLDNRLGLFELPISEDGLLDPKAEKYLDNPRLTMTYLRDFQFKNLYLQYEKALEEGWYDKIAFLQFDEPHVEEHMDRIAKAIRNVKNRFDSTQHINPFYVDLPKGDQTVIDRMAELSTVHCPKSSYFYKNKDAFMALKERGDTLMWYVCGDQPYNMIDTLPCVPGTEKRILFWQQYQNGVDGILHYQTTSWSGVDDIWEDGYEEKKQKFATSLEDVTANGVFFYWDPITGDPVSTLTLEAVRDGIEDFQLLKMAEEVLGKEEVMKYVERITTSLTEFTKDGDLLRQVRVELGNALEAAMAK